MRHSSLAYAVLPILFLVNCSTSQKKATLPPELAETAFRYTANDTDNCADSPGICLSADAVTRHLPAGVTSGKVSLDAGVVTNADYQKCVGDMHCEKNGRAVGAAGAPAINLNFEAAMRYCAWAGRRLPTVAELKAGIADPAFARTEYNEWSNDWALSPGASCTQKDRNLCEPANPMGICSGVFPCNATLKLKQTIALQSGEVSPTAHTTKGKLAFRCASHFAPSTAAPPWILKNPPAALPDPAPLSASERALLHNLEATDTLNKPICKEKFTSPAHCKDPVTYFTPNESQNYQFAPYIRNLGGGYAGVAADANYSYIAAARSRFVWLFDFDVNINALHRIIRAMVLESPTVVEFLQKFEKKNNKLALEILEKYYKDRDDLDFIQQVYRNNFASLGKHYKASAAPDKKQGEFGWLRFADNYRYIRLLYTQDRITIVPGDMLKDKSMRSIGKSARALGVPIRVYYPSNAEEFWNYTYNDSNYKKNILSLPFDEASITFRSVHEYPWHPTYRKGFKGFWHYVVHGAYNYQKRLLLPHYDYMDYFKMHRVLSKTRADFSTIEIPSSIPKGILEQDR